MAVAVMVTQLLQARHTLGQLILVVVEAGVEMLHLALVQVAAVWSSFVMHLRRTV